MRIPPEARLAASYFPPLSIDGRELTAGVSSTSDGLFLNVAADWRRACSAPWTMCWPTTTTPGNGSSASRVTVPTTTVGGSRSRRRASPTSSPASSSSRASRGAALRRRQVGQRLLADLEHVSQRLADALGADAGWSETKYLRLAGTLSHKADPPLPVRLVEARVTATETGRARRARRAGRAPARTRAERRAGHGDRRAEEADLHPGASPRTAERKGRGSVGRELQLHRRVPRCWTQCRARTGDPSLQTRSNGGRGALWLDNDRGHDVSCIVVVRC